MKTQSGMTSESRAHDKRLHIGRSAGGPLPDRRQQTVKMCTWLKCWRYGLRVQFIVGSKGKMCGILSAGRTENRRAALGEHGHRPWAK